MFVGAHILLAEKTGIPELGMSFDEGQQFMKAAQNVMRHYSVQTTQKTMDWIAFGGVACMIYVPRVVALANNRPSLKLRTASRTEPQPVHVQRVETAPGAGSPMEAAFAMNTVQPEHEH